MKRFFIVAITLGLVCSLALTGCKEKSKKTARLAEQSVAMVE